MGTAYSAPAGSIKSSESKFLARTRKRAKFIRRLAEDPANINGALVAAGLPSSLAQEAEGWDETIVIRRQMWVALDKAELTADYIARKLKEQADKGSLRAIELICKLRGYNDPIHPKTRRPPSSPGDSLREELERRERILDLTGLRFYPIPPGEAERREAGDDGEGMGTEGMGGEAEGGVAEAGSGPIESGVGGEEGADGAST